MNNYANNASQEDDFSKNNFAFLFNAHCMRKNIKHDNVTTQNLVHI